MNYEFEGAITGVSLYEHVASSITITNVQPGHAIQKVTLEISNRDIAKAIAVAHGIDRPFKITIGGDEA